MNNKTQSTDPEAAATEPGRRSEQAKESQAANAVQETPES